MERLKPAAGEGRRQTRAAAGKRRRSRVELAYAEIKRRILGSVYPPNAQALEQDLAADLGMSRTPVREALIRLEKEGLVEILPRHGMRVVPIALDDLREIYEVLTCLEAHAAARLAARRPSAAEVRPLAEAVEAMEAALLVPDLDAWAAADARFHGLLLELAGNRRMVALAATVADQAHRARMATLRLRPLPTRSNEDHRAVLAAIRAGDAETAGAVHRRHREAAMEMLTGILRAHALTRL